MRPGDTLGRFGGDEFVAVAEGVAPEAAAGFGERLRAAVEDVGARAGMPVTASVGLALVDASCEPDEVLRRADGAMYAAKRAGGDRVVAFEEALRPQVARRLRLGSELRGAARRGELRLVFQPIYALGDGRLDGVEALLRWDGGALGAVPPAEFIPVAEETGQMPALGAWVLREACRRFVEHAGGARRRGPARHQPLRPPARGPGAAGDGPRDRAARRASTPAGSCSRSPRPRCCGPIR